MKNTIIYFLAIFIVASGCTVRAKNGSVYVPATLNNHTDGRNWLTKFDYTRVKQDLISGKLKRAGAERRNTVNPYLNPKYVAQRGATLLHPELLEMGKVPAKLAGKVKVNSSTGISSGYSIDR